ncbi:hypothetical protein [Sediminibacterium soli]|uniref:hypothetical protein n=1 Tax=Sediminibacterium soli TaxID=2698829 RepID=UPI00137B2EDF|nr:hypothetical protein [Sediminibacterium soli]NCI46239.1 hypothetical protein [Sediminibacterium soli]
MLSSEEESFIGYWEKNREAEKNSLRPFFVGLSGGFAIGIGTLLLLSAGWYERANMEANSRLSSFLLVFAILAISFFLAFFYRKFRWEMQEQRYRELLARKKKTQNE